MTTDTGGKISHWFPMCEELKPLRTNLTPDLEVSRGPNLVQTENLLCHKKVKK